MQITVYLIFKNLPGVIKKILKYLPDVIKKCPYRHKLTFGWFSFFVRQICVFFKPYLLLFFAGSHRLIVPSFMFIFISKVGFLLFRNVKKLFAYLKICRKIHFLSNEVLSLPFLCILRIFSPPPPHHHPFPSVFVSLRPPMSFYPTLFHLPSPPPRFISFCFALQALCNTMGC